MNEASLNENLAGDFPDALPPQTPLRGGDYVIETAMGRGGFALTYQARDEGLQRFAAIKEFFPHGAVRDQNTLEVLAPSTREFEQAKEQFLLEARTLAQFKHENIVHVHAVFEENATAYLAMEWVKGSPLARLVNDQGPFGEAYALRIAAQIGDALSTMHAANMLHLDITPGNVMLDEGGGRAVLLDFGLSKRIQTAVDYATVRLDNLGRFGTPGFAAIEQYTRTGELGVYTDVYGFAATLYFLLTGKEPPEASTRATGAALTDARSLNPDVSENVAKALERALRLPPDERPASVEEFLGLLEGRATDTPRVDIVPVAAPIPTIDGEVLPRGPGQVRVVRRRYYQPTPENPIQLFGLASMLPMGMSCAGIGCSIGCFIFIALFFLFIAGVMNQVGQSLPF